MKKRLWIMGFSSIILGGSVLFGTDQIAVSVTEEPEVADIFVQTRENDGVYGDAIVVVFSEPMLIDSQPNPLAGGMEDVNNVAGSELKAPAEYPRHHGHATARRSAQNYRIKITPGPYSHTQAFTGTWADLGGEALYHPGDSNKRMVLLKPPSKGHRFFEPGDQVEVTVAETIVDPQGNRMKVNRNKKHECAS